MGIKSQINGLSFEQIFKLNLKKAGITFTSFPPSGARCVGVKVLFTRFGKPIKVPQFKTERMPYDFALFHKGLGVTVDTKSVEKGNKASKSFFESKSTKNQVYEMKDLDAKNAGFVVGFEEANRAVFFSAKQAFELAPRESLTIDDGLYLGSYDKFNAGRLFEF